MMFKKAIQFFLVTVAVMLLMSCSSTRKHDDAAVNDANAAYQQNDAQSSGLGEESSFGDQAGGDQLLSKRVFYFDFDSNVVHDEDKPAIAANADYLVAHSNVRIVLEGHTDPRGSREYNIALGERRAKAVAQILTEKGVSPAQIRVVSYGAQKLASMGHSEADFQLDRRVVLATLQR